jgi:hypothetical protein
MDQLGNRYGSDISRVLSDLNDVVGVVLQREGTQHLAASKDSSIMPEKAAAER